MDTVPGEFPPPVAGNGLAPVLSAEVIPPRVIAFTCGRVARPAGGSGAGNVRVKAMRFSISVMFGK